MSQEYLTDHGTHPQLEKKEVYVGDFTEETFEALNHISKRLGYGSGNGSYPVFVAKWELSRHLEAEEEEIFLRYATQQEFQAMAWNSKRLGRRHENGLFLVFVSRGEHKEMRSTWG